MIENKLNRWDIFASIAQSARHPDEFIQEFIEPTSVCDIRNLTRRCIEEFAGAAEVDIGENRYHAELAQHGKKILDHASAAEGTGRNAADASRLVDVLFQIRIEDMF